MCPVYAQYWSLPPVLFTGGIEGGPSALLDIYATRARGGSAKTNLPSLAK